MLSAIDLWKKPWLRAWVYQITLVLGFVGIAVFFIHNAINSPSLGERGFSFAFLFEPSGFEMGENVLGVSPDDPNWKVFFAGVVNTLIVSVVAIVACAVIGFFVALARISHRRWLSRLALLYIETNRNIPLLLHILFWYAIVRSLPSPRQADPIWPGVFASNRGLVLPEFSFQATSLVWLLGGVGVSLLAASRVLGKDPVRVPLALKTAGFAAILGGCFAGASIVWPELVGLRYRNAWIISPEFIALFVSLTIYQSGFFAETVRSGILGVNRGQYEAAASLGLGKGRTLRLIVMPQALRIMVPSIISQFGGLIKNSSLGVLIAYPEVVRVSMAASVDTGRIVECTLIIMASFLFINLFLSVVMSWLNQRVAFVEA